MMNSHHKKFAEPMTSRRRRGSKRAAIYRAIMQIQSLTLNDTTTVPRQTGVSSGAHDEAHEIGKDPRKLMKREKRMRKLAMIGGTGKMDDALAEEVKKGKNESLATAQDAYDAIVNISSTSSEHKMVLDVVGENAGLDEIPLPKSKRRPRNGRARLTRRMCLTQEQWELVDAFIARDFKCQHEKCTESLTATRDVRLEERPVVLEL